MNTHAGPQACSRCVPFTCPCRCHKAGCDFPPAPPECAWCPSPATEQVYVGTHYRQQQPSRRYAWFCTPCANHIEHEVNHD